MNYYTNFCFEIPGTPEQHNLLQDMLWTIDHLDGETSLPDEMVASLKEVSETWGETCADATIVRNATEMFVEDDAGEGSYGVVADVISLWMKHFKMTDALVFQVAFTAQRHTPDAFGGGVVWINKEETIFIDTSDLARIDMSSKILGDIINY